MKTLLILVLEGEEPLTMSAVVKVDESFGARSKLSKPTRSFKTKLRNLFFFFYLRVKIFKEILFC